MSAPTMPDDLVERLRATGDRLNTTLNVPYELVANIREAAATILALRGRADGEAERKLSAEIEMAYGDGSDPDCEALSWTTHIYFVLFGKEHPYRAFLKDPTI